MKMHGPIMYISCCADDTAPGDSGISRVASRHHALRVALIL